MTTLRLRAAAILAVAGLFLSLYLLLYKLGFYGELICGDSGSCDYVQSSSYAYFLGIPIAGWGAAWYAAVLSAALLRLGSGGVTGKTAGPVLGGLAAAGLGFSVYLTAVELFVLHAICRWCVGSAALTVAIFVLVAPWRRTSGGGAPEAFEGGPVL
ncbi:MAG: vitamin K epoxide reductase family protein [Gemmatimonadota bacterium]